MLHRPPNSFLALTATILTSFALHMDAPIRQASDYVPTDADHFAVAVNDYSSSPRLIAFDALQIYVTFSVKADNPQTKERCVELTKHGSLRTSTIPQEATTHLDDPEEFDDEGTSTRVPFSTNRRRTIEADPSKRIMSTPHKQFDPPNTVRLQHTIDTFKQGGITEEEFNTQYTYIALYLGHEYIPVPTQKGWAVTCDQTHVTLAYLPRITKEYLHQLKNRLSRALKQWILYDSHDIASHWIMRPYDIPYYRVTCEKTDGTAITMEEHLPSYTIRNPRIIDYTWEIYWPRPSDIPSDSRHP